MNHHILAIATVSVALSLTGCKRDADVPIAPVAAPVPVDETRSAVISEVDHASPASAAPGFDAKAFAGLYAATLPCADCPGIDTSLTFTADGVYSMSETYQGRTDGSFVTTGTWTVREDGKTVLLDPEDKEARDRWFQVVSSNELRMLDQEGKPIDGALDYSLRRK